VIDILIMGEMIVEIMRSKENAGLDHPDVFVGPFPSGAPAICIDTAARLGCRTAIIGGVGKDDFGKCIISRLKQDGVDVSHVIESTEGSTGCAFVTYFSDGSRKFIFHMENTPAVAAKAPSANDFPLVKYMHIMGCSLMASKVFALEILSTMRMVKEHGAKISFDPNIRRELHIDASIHKIIDEVMQNTSIFLPGTEELLLITGTQSISEALEKCFHYPCMEIVALKNGSKGCSIYTKKGRTEQIGTYQVVQKDATGAGDCFDGAFLAGLVQGKSIIEAAKMGAVAGALNAAEFGPMEGKFSEQVIHDIISSSKNWFHAE